MHAHTHICMCVLLAQKLIWVFYIILWKNPNECFFQHNVCVCVCRANIKWREITMHANQPLSKVLKYVFHFNISIKTRWAFKITPNYFQLLNNS